MRKIFLMFVICVLCLIGCASEDINKEKLSDTYHIGDEVELGDTLFNIYKIDDDNNELYLMTQKSIVNTKYSADGDNYYEYSLVDDYVDEFVEKLEAQDIVINSSGIIDIDDLHDLGFENSDGLSGLPYRCGEDTPDFVKYEEYYWVGGYCKYDTMSWAYFEEMLDAQPCNDEYTDEFGVRPIIVISPSEIEK